MRNKNAIHLFEENPKNNDCINISGNPSIFELDYKQMRINNQDIYMKI